MNIYKNNRGYTCYLKESKFGFFRMKIEEESGICMFTDFNTMEEAEKYLIDRGYTKQ